MGGKRKAFHWANANRAGKLQHHSAGFALSSPRTSLLSWTSFEIELFLPISSQSATHLHKMFPAQPHLFSTSQREQRTALGSRESWDSQPGFPRAHLALSVTPRHSGTLDPRPLGPDWGKTQGLGKSPRSFSLAQTP